MSFAFLAPPGEDYQEHDIPWKDHLLDMQDLQNEHYPITISSDSKFSAGYLAGSNQERPRLPQFHHSSSRENRPHFPSILGQTLQ